MRSKSNKRRRNISGQPLATETQNNPQNPHFPYIYDLPNRQVEDSPDGTHLLIDVANGAKANVLQQDDLYNQGNCFFSSFFSHTNTHACHPCI